MVNLPPDSRRYLAMHQRRVCRPFHLRWLLPLTLRGNLRAWTWATRTAIVAIGLLTAIYTGSPWMAAVAFLPAMTWNWHNPVMVDMVGMAWALATTLVALQGWWWLAIPMALIGGTIRETVPIWTAIYTWNPILLVGLAPVAIRWAIRQGADTWTDHNADLVAHPFKAGQLFHKGRWRDPFLMITPWGGLIAGVVVMAGGVFDAPGGVGQVGVALAAGYLPLLVATDSVRIYQWAAPVLALACVEVLPAWALPLIAISIVFNPWRGPGT